MANSYQDLSQIINQLVAGAVPQQISTTTNGASVDMNVVGTNRINSLLMTGAAVGLTSLTVTFQSSPDNTNWTTIPGVQHTVVTAGSTLPEIIDFQLPEAASYSSSAPIYLRPVFTLVGTSVYVAQYFLTNFKIDSGLGYQNSPPVIN